VLAALGHGFQTLLVRPERFLLRRQDQSAQRCIGAPDGAIRGLRRVKQGLVGFGKRDDRRRRFPGLVTGLYPGRPSACRAPLAAFEETHPLCQVFFVSPRGALPNALPSQIQDARLQAAAGQRDEGRVHLCDHPFLKRAPGGRRPPVERSDTLKDRGEPRQPLALRGG